MAIAEISQVIAEYNGQVFANSISNAFGFFFFRCRGAYFDEFISDFFCHAFLLHNVWPQSTQKNILTPWPRHAIVPQQTRGDEMNLREEFDRLARNAAALNEGDERRERNALIMAWRAASPPTGSHSDRDGVDHHAAKLSHDQQGFRIL